MHPEQHIRLSKHIYITWPRTGCSRSPHADGGCGPSHPATRLLSRQTEAVAHDHTVSPGEAGFDPCNRALASDPRPGVPSISMEVLLKVGVAGLGQ